MYKQKLTLQGMIGFFKKIGLDSIKMCINSFCSLYCRKSDNCVFKLL